MHCLISWILLLHMLLGDTFACNTEGCINNDCNFNTGKCRHGCKQGYSGDRCYTCISGYYESGNYPYIYCYSCSAGCLNGICGTNGNCTNGCTSGYWGQGCASSCSSRCYGNTCDIGNGVCTHGCTSGYWGNNCAPCSTTCNGSNCSVNHGYCTDGCVAGYYGRTCSAQCNIGCIDRQCKNDGTCDCNTGYTGAQCEICSNGFYYDNGECTYCPDNCLSCTSPSNCHSCRSGFYGNTCSTPCSFGCINNVCATDGTCNVTCYTDGNCYSSSYCKTGYSGPKCNCQTDGCTDSLCTACTNNTWYWISNRCCKCSFTCRNSICDNTGICSEGCIDGFYGKSCQNRCLDMDKNCLICENDKCTQCLVGYYSNQSSRKCITCSEQCLNNNCSSIDGKCIGGCRQGFWGEHCNLTCEEHCLECDKSSGMCNICEEQRFKRNCSGQCSEDCLKQSGSTTCNIDTGACNLGCSTTTKYGEYCIIDCGNKCFNSECNWKTGTCTNGCIANHYGQKCETPCNNACVTNDNDSRCDHKDGSCRFGCEVGHYGDRCDAECGSNCANRSCTRTNGECEQGCTDGFSGTFCAQAIKQDGPVNTGMIAGASAGAALFLIIIAVVLVVILVFRRRKTNKNDDIDFSSNTQNLGSSTNNETGAVYNNTSASENEYEVLGDRRDPLFSNDYQCLNMETNITGGVNQTFEENTYQNLMI